MSRRALYVVAGLGALSSVVQVLYPVDRAFFGAYIDQQPVAFKTRSEIEKVVDEYYQSGTVALNDINYAKPLAEAGVVVDAMKTANVMLDYPWWQRIIPFGGLYRALTGHMTARYTTNGYIVSEWAYLATEACKRDPVNAGVVVDANGSLNVSPAQPGRVCDAKTIGDQLQGLQLTQHMTIDARPRSVPPLRSDADVEKVLLAIRPIVQQGITINALDHSVTADAKTIAPWLQFFDNPDATLAATVDLTKMQAFIDHAQSAIYIAPGTTTIDVVDGIETNRVTGAAGRGIDQAKLASDIQAIFRDRRNRTVEAAIVSLSPKQVYHRTYTNTSAGLQALLAQLVRDNGSVAITVSELGGQGRTMSENGTKQYHPASTYKLSVAYSVIKRIEAGQLQWGDAIGGKTVESCMETMIVDSDNPCAYALRDLLTLQTIHDDAQSIGMSGTYFATTNYLSNTNDQALLLRKLQRGELMHDENKQKLLGYLQRQKFRSGIPAGAGVSVADKVGFLGPLIHDSAIVYSPNGTYTLTIYTSGSSWSSIADMARQINTLLGS